MKIIDFYPGCNLEEAYQHLQDEGEACMGEFNGSMLLYTDTIDDVYKKVTGLTKTEYDARRQAENDEYHRKQEEHKASIPRLTEEWIEKGKTFLKEKYWEKWAECVPIRLGDLYEGMELQATQEILEILDKSENLDEVFEEANDKLNSQGHSGMSYGLMKAMISSFHDLGKGFVNRLKY